MSDCQLHTDRVNETEKAVSTDAIEVGLDYHGEQVKVFIFAGLMTGDEPLDTSTSAVVISTDTFTDPLLNISRPTVARRLGEALIASATVLEQIQNGDLP